MKRRKLLQDCYLLFTTCNFTADLNSESHFVSIYRPFECFDSEYSDGECKFFGKSENKISCESHWQSSSSTFMFAAFKRPSKGYKWTFFPVWWRAQPLFQPIKLPQLSIWALKIKTEDELHALLDVWFSSFQTDLMNFRYSSISHLLLCLFYFVKNDSGKVEKSIQFVYRIASWCWMTGSARQRSTDYWVFFREFYQNWACWDVDE